MRPAREHVVVFAGAGASTAAGYAQTGEILSEVLRRLRSGGFRYPALAGREPELLRRAEELLPGLAAVHDAVELADVVSILDHCVAEGEALGPELRVEDLRAMRRLLDFAMAEVLAAPLPGRPAPVPPERFAQELVDRFLGKGRELTVVSTNYDVSLDLALFGALERRGLDPASCVDLGFTRRDMGTGRLVPPPQDPALRLLKLHGALNWLRCSRCGTCMVDFRGSITHHAGDEERHRSCPCGHAPLEMLLVAPSLVRDVRDVSLRSTWQVAVESLRDAGTWIFVGFALRGEDLAIRSVLARARLSSPEARRRIVVVGKGDEEPPSFALFLGEHEYVAGGLERFLDAEPRA